MTTPEVSPLGQQLRQLADEIRVQIHLAGMEAKDAWAKLEPRLRQFESKAEHAAEKVGDELTRVGRELERELTDLRDRVTKG